MTSYVSDSGNGCLFVSDDGVSCSDQSRAPVETQAEDCESRCSFRETLLARLGTMASRSVRWIVAEEPQIAANDRPTRPVPAPSSRARSGRWGVDPARSLALSAGGGTRSSLRRFDNRYEDTQVLLPRLSEVRDGSLSVMVKLFSDLGSESELQLEDRGMVKERRRSGIATHMVYLSKNIFFSRNAGKPP